MAISVDNYRLESISLD